MYKQTITPINPNANIPYFRYWATTTHNAIGVIQTTVDVEVFYPSDPGITIKTEVAGKYQSLTPNDVLRKSVYDPIVIEGATGAEIQAVLDDPATPDGARIELHGDFVLTAPIVIPDDKSLTIVGMAGAKVGYATFDPANGNGFEQNSSTSTKLYTFEDLKIQNAGGYGLYIRSSLKAEVLNCEFKFNGWNGQGMDTINDVSNRPAGWVGYDSSQAELQAFWASNNTSNGGAMRIRSSPVCIISDNTIAHNLRGARIQDCGIGGRGVISRNQAYQNIESGLYLAASSYGYLGTPGDGCENFSVYNNASIYNSNNGILVIGGINNIIALNRIEGNWNAGNMLWNVSDTRSRDMDFDNNNRSQFNGIGNPGDADASFQIAGPKMRDNATYLCEVLDTTIQNTGVGANTDGDRIGLHISNTIPAPAASGENQGLPAGRPRISIDNVSFVNHDTSFKCDANADELRLTFVNNRMTQVTGENVVLENGGAYSAPPYSNAYIDAGALDFSVDPTGSRIYVRDTVHVIETFAINSIQAAMVGTRCRILLKDSERMVWDSLEVSNITISGVSVSSILGTAVGELNALFSENTSFSSGGTGAGVTSGVITGNDLVLQLADGNSITVDVTTLAVDSDNSVVSGAVDGNTLNLTMDDGSIVPINIDTLSPGHNPTYPGSNWYYAFGTNQGQLLPLATWFNSNKNLMPAYFGQSLAKGKEFIWTHDGSGTYNIGVWIGATNVPTNADGVFNGGNWSLAFNITSNDPSIGSIRNQVREVNSGVLWTSVGCDINSRHPSGFQLVVGDQLCFRHMDNNKIGLFKVTDGANVIIAESNNTYTGNITVHGGGQAASRQAKMPTFLERESIFSIAHAADMGGGVLETDWRDGTEPGTVLVTNQTFGPGYKMVIPIVNLAAGQQRWGLGYTGPASGGTNPSNFITNKFRYGANESIYQLDGWSFNTSATYYDAVNNQYLIQNGAPIGTLEIRYFESNVISLWSVLGNERVATLDGGGDGTDLRVYTGQNQYAVPTANIPIITREPLNPAAPTPDDLAPDASDQSFSSVQLDPINYTVQLDADSDLCQMYAFPDLPLWLTGNQATGVIIGTAPAHGGGATDDTYTFTAQLTNDYGIRIITVNVNVMATGAGSGGYGIAYSTTPYTKAWYYDGVNDYSSMASSQDLNNPMRRTLTPPGTITAGKTGATGQPWASSIVVYPMADTNEKGIFSQQETGAGPTCSLVFLADNKLQLIYGTDFGYIKFTSTAPFPTDQWYGLYLEYNGGTTGIDAGDLALYYSRFRIKVVDLVTGGVSDVPGAWTHSPNVGYDGDLQGTHYVSSMYSSSWASHCKVASHVVTTLRCDVDLPTDLEIQRMTLDPKKWVTDYRVGELYRIPNQTTDHTSNFALDDVFSMCSTQVWLFGDSVGTSFPWTRNEVYLNDAGGTTLMVAQNMDAGDEINVNISSSTPWTKAVNFDSTADNCRRIGDATDSPLWSDPAGVSGGQPWAVSTVFRAQTDPTKISLWSTVSQSLGNANVVWCYLTAAQKVELLIGNTSTGDTAIFTSTDSVSWDTWYGLVVTYDGTSPIVDGSEFRIAFVGLQTGTVTDIAGTWSINGTPGGTIEGRYFVGTWHSSGWVFNGDIASNVCATLLQGETVTDGYLEAMTRDPLRWVANSKQGTQWRKPDEASATTDFQTNDNDASTGGKGTQIYLMGDGLNDVYPTIPSEVSRNVTSTNLNMIQMTSDDIVDVTIPGLSD